MTDTKRMMQFEARKKGAGVAYVLWFFLGTLGAHRMYLGRTGSGLLMLAMTVLSWLLTGGIGMIVVGLWALIDVFLIGGMVQAYNERLAQELG